MSHAKHCLVLGGRGFIGSHLVDALLAAGHRVRCFDRPNVKRLEAPSSVGVNPLGNFELFEGDLGNDFTSAHGVRRLFSSHFDHPAAIFKRRSRLRYRKQPHRYAPTSQTCGSGQSGKNRVCLLRRHSLRYSTAHPH